MLLALSAASLAILLEIVHLERDQEEVADVVAEMIDMEEAVMAAAMVVLIMVGTAQVDEAGILAVIDIIVIVLVPMNALNKIISQV